MTAQALDAVRWEGRTWALVGHDGTGLFEPASIGVTPVMLHTAAWRGYICTYGVADGMLLLERLEIGFDQAAQERAQAGDPPLVGGMAPRQDRAGHVWLYDPVAMPVPFSGGLRVGERFIRDLYVHMGFAPAWKFEEVHELRFDAGRLVSTSDLSEEMRGMRKVMSKEPLQPPRRAGLDRVTDWIRSTFDQRYGSSRARDPDREDR